MRAAVFYDRGDVRVEAVPDPVPGSGELLVEVGATGICGTDAHEYAHGPAMFPIHQRHPVTGHVGPMIPGHELAGRVVATGDGVVDFREDELVVSGAGISCGRCPWCRRGRTNLCSRYASVGLERHGGLAQYCAVPAASCRSAEPYELTDDASALGQPMSIAVHAMRRGRLSAEDDATIIGAGGIGAFLTFAAASTGARVTVLDLDPQRLELAERLGADQVLRPDPGSPITDQLDLSEGSPTVVYEVSGTPAGLETALELLPAGGRLVQVGLQPGVTELALRPFTLREFELIGTQAHSCGADLPEALRLLATRKEGWRDVAPVALSLDRLVPDGLVPLAEGHSRRVKTLVDPWADEPRDTRM